MQCITTRETEIPIAELKEAITSSNGLKLIRPFDKISIELKSGEYVRAICGGYVGERRAHFLLEDCIGEKGRMCERPSNEGGYFYSEGRRYV